MIVQSKARLRHQDWISLTFWKKYEKYLKRDDQYRGIQSRFFGMVVHDETELKIKSLQGDKE